MMFIAKKSFGPYIQGAPYEFDGGWGVARVARREGVKLEDLFEEIPATDLRGVPKVLVTLTPYSPEAVEPQEVEPEEDEDSEDSEEAEDNEGEHEGSDEHEGSEGMKKAPRRGRGRKVLK